MSGPRADACPRCGEPVQLVRMRDGSGGQVGLYADAYIMADDLFEPRPGWRRAALKAVTAYRERLIDADEMRRRCRPPVRHRSGEDMSMLLRPAGTRLRVRCVFCWEVVTFAALRADAVEPIVRSGARRPAE